MEGFSLHHLIPEGEAGNHVIRKTAEGVTALLRKEKLKTTTVMSDTKFELSSNRRFLYHSNGDVLVAGMGIGMVIVPLLHRDDVRSITIVEREQDVIDLVLPHIKKMDNENKIRIIRSDIFDLHLPDRKFDTIYFDIWDKSTLSNLSEINDLRIRFAGNMVDRRLNPSAWMGAWMEVELRRRHSRMAASRNSTSFY